VQHSNGNHEESKPFERYRWRWEDNINMNLRKTGLRNFDFIHFARGGVQLRVLVKILTSIFSWTTYIYLFNDAISIWIDSR
jgi:hypothetical protein